MINVVADKYLFELEDMAPDEVNLRLYDPENGLPEDLSGTHALLIRTVTPINAQTIGRLPDSLSFIGTGSAGTDHVNVELLKEKDIAFANAAGCNARSVAEYVCTALLIWADEKEVSLTEKKVGIVGVGHVGSELNQMLQKLGITTICHDPPRALRDAGFQSASKSEVLDADILTLHTPLITSGKYPTYHWLNEEKLSNRQFDMVLNTARGGVVDEQALLKAQSEGNVGDFVIDVWENEPNFNDAVAKAAFLFTPHIAGYSIQAKQRATYMILEAMCKHFSISLKKPSFAQNNTKIEAQPLDFTSLSLSDILKTLHPITQYQKELSKVVGKQESIKKNTFNKIRATFPLRSEYAYMNFPPLPNKYKDTLNTIL